MIQETFPEIQAATEALEKQIAVTVSEIEQMKATIADKKLLVRGCARQLPQSPPNKQVRRRQPQTRTERFYRQGTRCGDGFGLFEERHFSAAQGRSGKLVPSSVESREQPRS